MNTVEPSTQVPGALLPHRQADPTRAACLQESGGRGASPSSTPLSHGHPSQSVPRDTALSPECARAVPQQPSCDRCQSRCHRVRWRGDRHPPRPVCVRDQIVVLPPRPQPQHIALSRTSAYRPDATPDLPPSEWAPYPRAPSARAPRCRPDSRVLLSARHPHVAFLHPSCVQTPMRPGVTVLDGDAGRRENIANSVSGNKVPTLPRALTLGQESLDKKSERRRGLCSDAPLWGPRIQAEHPQHLRDLRIGGQRRGRGGCRMCVCLVWGWMGGAGSALSSAWFPRRTVSCSPARASGIPKSESSAAAKAAGTGTGDTGAADGTAVALDRGGAGSAGGVVGAAAS